MNDEFATLNSERAIYEEFVNGDMKYLDAVGLMELRCGSLTEAFRIVDEWIEANSEFGTFDD